MAHIEISEDDHLDFSTYLRATYEGVLKTLNVEAALALDFGGARLAQAVRRTADRSVDPLMPGKAAERWLLRHVAPIDDSLRRGAVATLALGLSPDALTFPKSVLALYPAMHMRLARFLNGAHAYDDDLFAKDIALAAGLAAPVGALTISVPTPEAPRFCVARLKRAAAGARRQYDQHGARHTLHWLSAWSLNPWIELHVDTRNLNEFNSPGFLRCYHRLADVLALRPDLAGVYGASWLYQPELSAISPNLAFARETAEAGGGRLVRLRADPMQTAFAISRSTTRKRLYLSGAYKPICYGMFWERDALLDWSRSARGSYDSSADAGADFSATSSSAGRRRR